MNNSTKIPKYSIVLPTRGRGYYIGNTIKSVLSQDYNNYELVIIDNNEDDLTHQEIKKYKSNKIRYFKTGNLPMWENWNFGYRQTVGQFILILTDRSLLYSRNSLSYLDNVINQEQYDVITWPMITAIESEDLQVESQILWGIGNKQNIVLTPKDYRQFIRNGEWDKYGMSAPKGFNSCISRDIASKIVEIYSSLYLPLNPDYSHSFMVLNSCEEVLHLAQPLFISANLKDSYESKVKAFQSDDNFYSQFGVTKEQSTNLTPIKSNVTIGWNMVYNDLYKVMLIQEGLILKEEIFKDAFLISVLKYCRKYRYDDQDVEIIIEAAIYEYLEYAYSSIDFNIRQELSKTIKYVFYKDNEIPIYEIPVKNITIKFNVKIIIKQIAKKIIRFFLLLSGRKKDIFSLFLKNSIR